MIGWLFKKKYAPPPGTRVTIVSHLKEMRIRDAWTENGRWFSRFWDLPDELEELLPDGTTHPHGYEWKCLAPPHPFSPTEP
jgi:hypothetical protein